MKDTEIVRNENYDLIMSVIDLLQFRVMKSLYNFNKLTSINPTSHELHEYMGRINLKYSFITISSRLSELRAMKFIRSYRVKGLRSTRNKLTTKGQNFMLWHNRHNPKARSESQ